MASKRTDGVRHFLLDFNGAVRRFILRQQSRRPDVYALHWASGDTIIAFSKSVAMFAWLHYHIVAILHMRKHSVMIYFKHHISIFVLSLEALPLSRRAVFDEPFCRNYRAKRCLSLLVVRHVHHIKAYKNCKSSSDTKQFFDIF